MIKRALVVTGDGIGNAIQSTPTVSELLNRGYEVDMWIPGAPTEIQELFIGVGACQFVFVSAAQTPSFGDYDLISANWMLAHRVPDSVEKKRLRPGLAPIANRLSESQAHWLAIDRSMRFSAMPPTWCRVRSDPEQLYNMGFGGSGRHLAMHMGGKMNFPWMHKRYPYYGAVVSMLLEFDQDLHIHIFGAGQDETIPHIKSDRITRHAGPLARVAGMIEACDVFLGNDAGLAHIAAAVGTPAAIVFGPTEVRKNLPPRNAVAITAGPMPCRPCQRGQFGKLPDGTDCHKGKEIVRCMSDIGVSHVFRVVNDMLEAHR